MDTFEILTEIYEIRDNSIAKGMAFQDALKFAEHKISKKYHIPYLNIRKLS
jgi:hypothetical protein